jgi:hypothetical protein
MFNSCAGWWYCRTSLLVAAGCIGLLAANPAAGEEVQVRAGNGRMFRGEVDPLTSRDSLVLRSGASGVVIRRAISWEQIEQVMSGGMTLSIEGLRGSARQAPVARRATVIDFKTLGGTLVAAEPSPAPRLAVRAVSMGIDAAVANWDGDVEMDGLLVELVPLDEQGMAVGVDGTVEVELFAPQRRDFDLAPLSGGDTLELVERWTRAISAADFGSSGVRLRLPFGAIHPELRPEWVASHYGLVHVRLAAPGNGVFEASRDGVRIQPWAPNRDRLEMQTGERFLWTERLGRRD